MPKNGYCVPGQNLMPYAKRAIGRSVNPENCSNNYLPDRAFCKL